MPKGLKRSIVLIDGSNFFHYLKEVFPKQEKPFRNLFQFGYSDFCQWLTAGETLVGKCYYVGAVREEVGNPKSKTMMINQQKFLARIEKDGLEVDLGYILKKDGYHEKGVDVKIATDLLVGAYEDKFDKVLVISSDTDLIPVIDKVIELGKEVIYVGFGHSPSYALQKHATASRLLLRNDLEPFQP